jgi:hypothetical protein
MPVSSTRHVSGNGRQPGTRAIRQAIEASADVQEHSIAQVIGEAVALHLGRLLAQVLPQVMPPGTGCLFCALRSKQAARDWQEACQDAAEAGEDQPAPPAEPPVAAALTWVTVTQLAPGPDGPIPVPSTVPVCFAHLRLPDAPPRQVGLVDPSGRAIIARG